MFCLKEISEINFYILILYTNNINYYIYEFNELVFYFSITNLLVMSVMWLKHYILYNFIFFLKNLLVLEHF